MPAELGEELRRAVTEHGGVPLDVVDPQTNAAYVLVTREVYDRLKPLFEPDPMSADEQRSLLRDAGRRAGWDDEEMEAYDLQAGHSG